MNKKQGLILTFLVVIVALIGILATFYWLDYLKKEANNKDSVTEYQSLEKIRQLNKQAGVDFKAKNGQTISWQIVLEEGRLQIKQDQDLIWQGPEDSETVQDFAVQDFDKDGVDEFFVIYWRYGDYGVDWEWLPEIRGNDKLSQHIYIYKFQGVKPKLMWGGSALARPIIQFSFEETAGKQPLILCTEVSSYQNFGQKEGELKLKWSGWRWIALGEN